MVKSGIGILSLLFLVSCVFSSLKTKELNHKQLIKMGTYLRVSLPADRSHLYEPTFKIVDDLEKELSHYDENSKLNFVIKNGESCTSHHFKELAKRAQNYKNLTRGYFNIFYNSHKKKPQLTPTKCGIILQPKGAKFDFGAIGKGYAVDIIRDYLIENDVSKGVVAFSGDITCLHKGCFLGVQNPLAKEEIALLKFKSKIKHISISTSGNYRRKNNIKGKTSFLSVTLISEKNNTKLDAFATAAYLMPVQEIESILLKNRLAYVLVTKDKKVILSENLNYFIEDLVFAESAKSFKIVRSAP